MRHTFINLSKYINSIHKPVDRLSRAAKYSSESSKLGKYPTNSCRLSFLSPITSPDMNPIAATTGRPDASNIVEGATVCEDVCYSTQCMNGMSCHIC